MYSSEIVRIAGVPRHGYIYGDTVPTQDVVAEYDVAGFSTLKCVIGVPEGQREQVADFSGTVVFETNGRVLKTVSVDVSGCKSASISLLGAKHITMRFRQPVVVAEATLLK